MPKIFAALGAVSAVCLTLSAWAVEESPALSGEENTAAAQTQAVPEEQQIPCPQGWTVENNPSVENSLSYLHEGGDLAVNITYIADSAGQVVEPEAYARVASEQLSCSLPVRSNLIDKAWSFSCDQQGVEAIVYGQQGNLVLLSISGRNDETETFLEDFVRFLSYQSRRN